MKDIPKYMINAKTSSSIKESRYTNLFKNIPSDFIKQRGVEFLKKLALIPIGTLERRLTIQIDKMPWMGKLSFNHK